MRFSVESDFYNKLLRRRDIILIVEHSGITPKRDEMLKALSGYFGVPENRIAILKILNLFGQHKVSVHCHIYDTHEDMLRYERKHVLMRQGVIRVGKTG